MAYVFLLRDNGQILRQPKEYTNVPSFLSVSVQPYMQSIQSLRDNLVLRNPSRKIQNSEFSRNFSEFNDSTWYFPYKDKMSTLYNNVEMINCYYTAISEVAITVPAFTSRYSAKDNIVSGDLFQLPQESEDTIAGEPTGRTQDTHHAPVGNVEPVKLKQQKSGLSKLYQSKLKKMKMKKTSQCCSICQQDFQKDEIILQLPCKHIFHRQGCIKYWLKCSVRCPLCKMDLYDHFRKQKEQEEAEWL